MIIVQSAIKYPDGSIFTARRHYQVIALAANLQRSSIGCEQGFITSSGEFVTREQAKSIAIESGQLNPSHEGLLYSEDLWPEEDFSY